MQEREVSHGLAPKTGLFPGGTGGAEGNVTPANLLASSTTDQ